MSIVSILKFSCDDVRKFALCTLGSTSFHMCALSFFVQIDTQHLCIHILNEIRSFTFTELNILNSFLASQFLPSKYENTKQKRTQPAYSFACATIATHSISKFLIKRIFSCRCSTTMIVFLITQYTAKIWLYLSHQDIHIYLLTSIPSRTDHMFAFHT